MKEPPIETRVTERSRRIDWKGAAAFLLLHLGVVAGLVLVRPTVEALVLGASLFALRTFALTAGYHRYFSHRAFQTSRPFQFGLAVLGAASFQEGPLWWSAHHRHHHRHSDRDRDVHSPARQGFLWAHVGWVFAPENDPIRWDLVRDWSRYPELVWLDRHHRWPAYGMALLAFGLAGWPGLVWGFGLSTLLLFQTTFAVNSLTHAWGSRRYDTDDDSRNNLWIALLTFGEGWHNNHHRYPGAARQGFFWWEIDVSYGVLKVLSWLGVVWDLRQPPARLLDNGNAQPITASPEAGS